MDKIWHTQSPRRTPTVSPRGSPFSSPRASPCHTPSGSPSTTRRQSPEELPPLPKPYTGNSSLLRHKNDLGMTMETGNNQLPPLPARNKRQSRPLSMRSRNNAPIHSTGTSYNVNDKKGIEHTKLAPQTSFHRRTRSDDQLDRSWDQNDFEEPPPSLQRSLSVTKSKPTENIFNSSNFLFSPQFGSNTSLSDHHPPPHHHHHNLHHNHDGGDGYQPMAFERGGSLKRLNLNRPVPVPPSSVDDDAVGDSLLPVQRPTTLSVIVGSRPGSVSDSDAPTPTLPPKKNKMIATTVCSPDEVIETLHSVAEKVGPGREDNESPSDDEKSCSMLKGDIVEIEAPFEIEDEKDAKEENGDDDSTRQRKQSEVYYPIPSNDFSREVISCHDFYDEDDDDDEPWKNYDAPVPIINTPTREFQPKWNASGSSDEAITPSTANTPSTEFAKYAGTNDPFLNDSFFKRKGEDDDEEDVVEETPPALPLSLIHI